MVLLPDILGIIFCLPAPQSSLAHNSADREAAGPHRGPDGREDDPLGRLGGVIAAGQYV